MKGPRQAQRDMEGMQMRALTLGIAVVVAIGLIWSVAVMSDLVPVVGSDMTLAAMSRPAE
jgi:cell division protein FtsW (lipid II flippase)